MTSPGDFTGTSSRGDFSEALNAAIAAAGRGLNAGFFTWQLKEASGTVGGFVGAHDITVTVSGRAGVAGAMIAKGGAPPTSNWHAWHDWMPGKPPTLHVVGVVRCPSAGYTVTLKPAAPQGINPAIYILELVVTPPTQTAAQVVTDVPVHYSEQTSVRYTEVFIVPENIRVPVMDVS